MGCRLINGVKFTVCDAQIKDKWGFHHRDFHPRGFHHGDIDHTDHSTLG